MLIKLSCFIKLWTFCRIFRFL